MKYFKGGPNISVNCGPGGPNIMGSKYSVTVPSLKVHKTNMVYYATDGPKKSAQD